MKSVKHLNLLFACVSTLILTACIGGGKATFDQKPINSTSTKIDNTNNSTITENIDSNLIFSGISTIDFKTDSTLRINWSASNLDAISYDIYNTTSNTPEYLTTVVGQTSTSAMLTSLNPGATYKFRVRMRTSTGFNDGNANDVSVTMNVKPFPPNALTLLAPTANPDFDNRATIQLSGVKANDVIKLYTDSACATTAVATGNATGATIDLQTSIMSPGNNNFYATATNSALTSSTCSIATTSYSYILCPDGFVEVPGSKYLTVDAFCVMQFEARQAGAPGSEFPYSIDGDKLAFPWTMNQISAQAECSNLDPLHYDLISNQEWLTIAHNIESTRENWSSGFVGIGMIPRGHSDKSQNGTDYTLAIDDRLDANNPYTGTGNSSADVIRFGWEQKRTHKLSNGSVIWDLGGNAWEWVDWSIDIPGLQSGPINCAATVLQFPKVSCPGVVAADYLPLNPVLTSVHGVGTFNGYTGGGLLRGGNFSTGYEAGIFTVDLSSNPSSGNNGFRCVYRHKNP